MSLLLVALTPFFGAAFVALISRMGRLHAAWGSGLVTCIALALFLIIDLGHTGYQTFGTEGFVTLDNEINVQLSKDITFRGVLASSGFRLATGDFNNDGNMDIAFAYDDLYGRVDILFGPFPDELYLINNTDVSITGTIEGEALGSGYSRR